MDTDIRYYHISDEVWTAGYFELRDTTVLGAPIFKWPLPKDSVYTVLQVGTVWHVMRRWSDCIVSRNEPDLGDDLDLGREGEGGECLVFVPGKVWLYICDNCGVSVTRHG